MAIVSYEFTWLHYLLNDLQIFILKLANLYCNNQVAVHIAANPILHEQIKHIELDCHLICEKIQSSLITTPA